MHKHTRWFSYGALLVSGCGGTSGTPSDREAGASAPAVEGGPAAIERDATPSRVPDDLPDAALVQAITPGKVDLLFMIDNSSSMADKQQVLADAVPDLVHQLTNPMCIRRTTGEGGRTVRTTVGASQEGRCEQGELDFRPVVDLHIGIISSSLGDLGSGSLCKEGTAGNDRGHLLNRVASGNATDTPFLSWQAFKAGESDWSSVSANFTRRVVGVQQDGCGFEMQLESVYRFLNDPDPYDHIEGPTAGGVETARLVGTDATLLAQRASFLRPDSAVAVVSISDENDCSMVAGGQGYVAFQNSDQGGSAYPRGTSACDSNPDDRCCINCFTKTDDVPSGCPAPTMDEACARSRSSAEDPRNLRCFDQKRKFGVDLLYPIARYVEGIRSRELSNRKGERVPNPLYADLGCSANSGNGGTGACLPPRDPSLVFYTMIVGVPWQDLARKPSDSSLAAGYLTSRELREQGQWAKIVPDVGSSQATADIDPFMRESVAPRAGQNPFTHEPIAPAGASGLPSVINGHEWSTDQIAGMPGSDLQFACIFPLPSPRDCSSDPSPCDCSLEPERTHSPLCWDPKLGAYSTRQFFGKAYPGVRQLQVLRELSVTRPDQAIAASICPANLAGDAHSDANYGYRPAVAALLERLRAALGGA